MRSVTELPATYKESGSINLKHDKKLMPFVSFTALAILILSLTLNAGGAVGDLYVVGLLLSKRGPLLVRDYGDGIVFYGL